MTDYVPSHKTAGDGPAVLFLHGLGGNRHSFDHQLEGLSHDYQCIAWDVPGYGGSPALPELSFDALPMGLSPVAGTVRFYAKELAPGFQIYASPVNISPAAPAMPHPRIRTSVIS